MIALISHFARYLFSSKDRENIDVKVIMIILLKLFIEITFHQNVSSHYAYIPFFRSKLGKLSGALPGALLCSKLLDAPRQGVLPGFFRFLSDVSVPLADDKISNEKLVQFGQIFLRKSFTKMRIVVA